MEPKLGRVHDDCAIARPQGLEESDRGLLHELHLAGHARRGVEKNRQIERHTGRPEEGDVLLDAILEDREIRRAQARDIFLIAVGYHDVEGDEIDVAAERGLW